MLPRAETRISRSLFTRIEDYRWANLLAVSRYQERQWAKSLYGIRAWVRGLQGIKPPMPYAERRKPLKST